MSEVISQGKNLRKAIKEGKPLQIVGTINAYTALLAEQAGHKAIYLSGGGVAASSLGVPDLGITTLQDVLIDVERIANVSSLPLLVLVFLASSFEPNSFLRIHYTSSLNHSVFIEE